MLPSIDVGLSIDTFTDVWCQGDLVEYNCTATSELRWEGTAFEEQCPEQSISASFQYIGSSSQCGIFSATTINDTEPDMTDNSNTVPVSRSLLVFRTSNSLMNDTIVCKPNRDGLPKTFILSKEPQN